VAFITVLLTPLLPSCVYIKIKALPPICQGPAASHRLTLRPRSHFPGFDRPAADRTGEVQLGISSNISGSNRPVERQERCNQAVVHARLSAMDRNSITALFLLYHRKRRRNGLHWFHPIIKQRKNSVPCKHYLMNITH